MNNKKKVLIISGIVSIVIFVFSLIVTCSIKEGFELGASLLSAFTSLITMTIALYLYDKFGLSKKIIDYQTDSVFKLIEALRNTSCQVKSEELTYNIPFGVNLESRKQLISVRNDGDKKLHFKTLSQESSPNQLASFIHDYWLPDTIKNKLAFLDFIGTTKEENFQPEKDRLIVEFEKDSCLYLVGHDSSFNDLIDSIERLKSEILSWLNQYTDIELKIDR